MTKRTGTAVLFIVTAAVAPALLSGCSESVTGTGRANPTELAQYKAEAHDQHVRDVTTKACQDFRQGRIQVINAANDVVDALNNEGGYDGATVGPKITTALDTISKWTGTVNGDLVPDVSNEVSGALKNWTKSADDVADSFKNHGTADDLNARGTSLNTAADAAQTVCALY